MNFKTYPLSQKVLDYANECSVELEIGTNRVEVWTLKSFEVSRLCHTSEEVLTAIQDVSDMVAE